jgi:hypothetical protein
MDQDLFSTLYTAYMVLAESNLVLFDRINRLEQRINTLPAQTGNSNYYAWQFYSTFQ